MVSFKQLLLLLVAALINQVVVRCEDATEDVVTSVEKFNQMIDDGSVFVMFFAPWCGHCQRLKPTWDQLMKDINTDETISITIMKVDCTQNTKLCSDQGVMGYPTLKLYLEDEEEAVRYKGSRDVASLKKFVMKSMGEEVDDEVVQEKAKHNDGLFDLTTENFQNHINKKGFHLIKFYAPWCGHCKRLEPTWIELAKAFIPKSEELSDKDITIARVDCTVHKESCKEHSVRGYPTLLLFNGGKNIENYMGSRDISSLKKFIEDKVNPQAKEEVEDAQVVEAVHKDGLYDLTNANFELHVKKKGYHLVKFYAPWCGHCKNLEPTWIKLAKLYQPKNQKQSESDVTISRIDCTTNRDTCTEFEVRGYPTVLLIKGGKKVEKYSQGRNLNSFQDYLSKYQSGDQKEQIQVEVGDASIAVNGLYDLKADNFQKHIEKGFHFVKFYAPWCGHCKRLEPTWVDLAKKFIDVKDTTISRVDCTVYTEVCQKFEVKGYPTLLFMKDGQKMEKYKGSRDLNSLQSFINEKIKFPNIQPKEEGKIQIGVSNNGLFDLNDQIFQAHTLKKGYHFIKFYAPWCGHCKRLEPTWKELGKKFKDDEEVTISRIDCTGNQKSCTDNEVRGYPTLLLFKDGKKIDKYAGSREINDLEDYVMTNIIKNKGNSADKIIAQKIADDNAKGVLSLHASNFEYNVATDATFVMFYAPWCGFCKKLKPTWLDLSQVDFSSKTKTPVKIANVDCTKNKDLCGLYSVTGFPTLILFVDGVEQERYKGSRQRDDLANFVVEFLNNPNTQLKQEVEKKSEETKQKENVDENIQKEILKDEL